VFRGLNAKWTDLELLFAPLTTAISHAAPRRLIGIFPDAEE
jgi:hypothetical protein